MFGNIDLPLNMSVVMTLTNPYPSP